MDKRPIAENLQTEGLRKAAVLLASLPDEDRSLLLRELDDQQVDTIAQFAATQKPPKVDEQEAIAREFETKSAEPESPLKTDRQTWPKSRDGHPAPVSPISNDLVMERLHNATPGQIAGLIVSERPQMVALVLSHLPAAAAAAVLEMLPTETQLAVTQRIGHLQPADAEALADVADVLRTRLQRRSAPLVGQIGGPSHVARIIHAMGRPTEKALLENLSQEDRELTDEVLRHIVALRTLNGFALRRQAA